MSRLFFIICIIFSSLVSFAEPNEEKPHTLNPNKSISQYTLKKWGVEDGLPTMSLTDIVQTKDKYLWIATYDGLCRFDGLNFNVFAAENESAFQSNSIITLEETKDGTLWIGTQKGILKYENHEFVQEPALDALKNSSIEQLQIDSKGNLWIGTTSEGLLKYNGTQLSKIDYPLLNQSPVKVILEDEKGVIWAGTDLGDVFQIVNNEPVLVQTASITGGVSCMYVDHSGKLWIGASKGLFVSEDGKSVKEAKAIALKDVRDVKEDRIGNLWFANNSGIFRFNILTQEIERFSESDGLPNNLLRKLLFDHQGNLWILSYRSGLFQLTDGIFTCFSKSEGIRESVVSSVLQIGKDHYWLGLEGGRIDVLRNGKITPLITSKRLPKARLKNLMIDSHSNVWVSTYGGLVKLDTNGQVIPLPKELKQLHNYIRLTKEGKDGSLWIGTRRKGVFKYDWDGELTSYNASNGLSSNYVLSIDETADGKMVIGTKNGINVIDKKGEIEKIQIDQGLPSSIVFDVLIDGENWWICTDLGFCRWREGKMTVFNLENGLPDNVVFDVLKDDNDNFWLSSNSGIIQIKSSELESYSVGKQIQARVYDKSDGMKSEQCVGAAKMFQEEDGTIWVPTIKGLATINPNQSNAILTTPEAYIEKLLAEDNQAFYPISANQITVAPEISKKIKIDFTAFDYVAPAKVRFKYRLLPFDKEWEYTNKLREITYTNLSPNTYTFEVIAGNHTDVWNEKKASFNFVIKPFFYETWWFYSLCVLTFLSVTYIFYRRRIQQAKRREARLQEMVKERTKEVVRQKQELEKTFEELKWTQAQVVQSEKMASLGQLTAGIAHEINNPVNFVSAGVDTLRVQISDLMELLDKYDGLEGGNLEEYASKMKEIEELKEELEYDEMRADISAIIGDITLGADRTAEIVKSLKVFARDDSTEYKPNDLVEIIESSLIILKNVLKDKAEVKKDYQSIPLVACSAGKIGQVFTNLISNAVDAMDGKGVVEVGIRKYSPDSNNKKLDQALEYVLVSIKDNGSGMSEDIMKNIFDPFFTTKDVGQGTGLGLSICQDIVLQHQGIIEVESEVGEGTEFKVILPVFR